MGILGLVETAAGERPLAAVTADIDLYYSCYPPPLVTGIFFDNVTSDCRTLPYYQKLYGYVHAKGQVLAGQLRSGSGADGRATAANQTVVLNAGYPSYECYMSASDILVTFSGDYSSYVDYQPSPWMAGYNASRFAHIVSGAAMDNMNPNSPHLDAMRRSKSWNAGHVYVTNATGPASFDNLPQPYVYWDQEPRWAVNII